MPDKKNRISLSVGLGSPGQAFRHKTGRDLAVLPSRILMVPVGGSRKLPANVIGSTQIFPMRVPLRKFLVRFRVPFSVSGIPRTSPKCGIIEIYRPLRSVCGIALSRVAAPLPGAADIRYRPSVAFEELVAVACRAPRMRGQERKADRIEAT